LRVFDENGFKGLLKSPDFFFERFRRAVDDDDDDDEFAFAFMAFVEVSISRDFCYRMTFVIKIWLRGHGLCMTAAECSE